jgi:aromatic ring-opening dioxygenase catalytic subunit (LigB family)
MSRPRQSSKRKPSSGAAAQARRALILEGIMLGQTRKQIHELHGFTVSTINAVVCEAHFKEQLAAAMEERRKAMHLRMEALAQMALKTHMEVMADVPHRDRLRAAESILDRAGASRVAKVEQTGTTLQIEAGSVAYDELEGKSMEELDHFAKTGKWPQKAKP